MRWLHLAAAIYSGVGALACTAAWLELRRIRRVTEAWLAARTAVRQAYAASLAGHPDEDRLDDEARLAIAAAWEIQDQPSAWIVRAAAPLLALLRFPVEEIRHPEEGHRG